MFSNWFSGDKCGQYRTSLYKRRMDQVGSRLLELRYANDVIRQHVCSPPRTPAWFAPILTPYLQFVHMHRGLAAKTTRNYTQRLSTFAQYLEGAGITELDRITPGHVREFY